MSATPSILGLGSSALAAYRSALSVTSNNISNVGVEGYSRQRADLSMADAMDTNAGFMGNGVETTQVARTYDQFLTRNLNTATSSANHYSGYHEYASAIDGIVADPEMGMTPALTSFFNALQDLSNAPASVPARQVLQGEGDALVSRFNTLHREMQKVRDQSKEEMGVVVEKINGISQSIAELNSSISNVTAGGSLQDKQPNDLLDQRDRLVKELSEYIGITAMNQDGMTNIIIGKGQSLVAGNTFTALTLDGTQYQDGDSLKVYMNRGKSNLDITSTIKGGRAGGIIDFTKDILNPAQDSLGRIAVTLSATLNAHHRTGFGLGGESDTGNNFFDMGRVSTSEGISSMFLEHAVVENTSAANLSISIPLNNSEIEVGPVTADAVSGLSINGFLIASSDAGADVEETATNIVDKINESASKTGVTAEVVDGDKIKLISDNDIVIGKLESGDIAATGLDEGTYRMVRSSIKELTTDGYSLSFNGTEHSIVNLNTDEVRILSADEVLMMNDASEKGGVLHDGLIFQLNTYYGEMREGEYIEVRAMRGAAQNIEMALSAADITSIAASDQADESGNNSNLLKMIALQSEKLMTSGSNGRAMAGIQESYGQMVSEIGVQTHYADINRQAQESIVNSAQASRDNNAAVNLDEEAANLMKYQQMYQASTRVISMADELFKAVLNAV